MPAATDLDATPAPGPEAARDPRRVVVTDLVARLLAGLTARARDYETAAGQAEGALGQALAGLGRAKHDQAADLLPLARALGASLRAGPAGAATPSSSPPSSAPSWGVVLGEAFQAERDLERTSWDLTTLAEDPALKTLGSRLAAAATRDAREVRKLYLRYS